MADKKLVIGFHKADEENGFLSNWYKSPFVLDGQRFSCVEQYMMYRKAAVFGDSEIMDLILDTEDPGTIKDLGRRVQNYDNDVWSSCRQVIVYRALLAKFEQNSDLKQKLMDTGDAILAECAHDDKIWGIGRYPTDDRRLDPKQWIGQNLLGYALMEVREQLKKNRKEEAAAPSAPDPEEDSMPESEEEDRINKVSLIYHRAAMKTQPCEETLVMDRTTGMITYEQHRGQTISFSQSYHVAGEVKSFLDAMSADLLSHRGEEDAPLPIPDPGLSGSCTITITYQSRSAEVFTRSFDQNGLPKWYQTFIGSIRNVLDKYALGDLFNPVLYRKVYPQNGELLYCSVKFKDNEKTYYYQTDDLTMDLGDEVEVPVGSRNTLKTGEIVNMECFTPKEAPFPADQVKEIAGKTIIKKAIGNFKGSRTTDNLLALMSILSDSMIWVPCNTLMGEEDQKQIEEMAGRVEDKDSLVGSTFTSKEEIHLVPDILQRGEEYFFPVFSSREEMGEYGNGFSKVQASFQEAIALARNNSTYKITGIVVNAFSNAFTLGWDLLEIIEGQANQKKE